MERNTAAILGVVMIVTAIGITMLYEPAEPETESSGLTTFESDQEFIDYMSSENPDSGTSEASRPSESASGYQDASGSQDLSAGDQQAASRESTQEAEWIQTTENSILISHRYPRHFNSVQIPDLDLEHNISGAGGRMLTSENLTVIQEQERIVAYDNEMNEEWEVGLDSYVAEMTRSGNQLILLTRETDFRCPIRPFDGVDIACTSILRPSYMDQNDYTYTLSRIDLGSGEEENSMSFVASSRTEVEQTPEKTYISYSDRKPEPEIMTGFLLNEASISSETRERVEALQGYDLTDRSMQIEIEAAIREHEKENMKELEQDFSEYDKENMKDYEESTLLTVDNSDLSHNQERFDGRISGIESENTTLLTIEYRGVDYENREKEIKVLGGSSTDIDGEAQFFNDNILVKEDKEIKVLDKELNELNSVNIDTLNIEKAGENILVSLRPEDPKRKSRMVLYNSELERLDSEELESWSLYSFNLVEGDERSYGLVHGYNSTYLLKVGEEIDLVETEASGQLVYQKGLYAVGDKVQKLSEDGGIEEELDLKIHRNYVPLPEPVER
ncbi:MAG: hypothetical protein V5A72_00875 [Candidatus Nanohaloarchaea archaeon]